MMEQREAFRNQLHVWAHQQENLGENIDTWSARVYVYAVEQNELLASPMTPLDVHNIAWSVASARWGAEHGAV